jgi:2-haloacid dehalogenase
LKEQGANVLVITNGAKATTEGYIAQAGLEGLVDDVRSCDEVGLAKPFAQVYEKAGEACELVEKKSENGSVERWFVAAHLWDLAAARKAG